MKNGKNGKQVSSRTTGRVTDFLEARSTARSLRVQAIEELEKRYPTPPVRRIPIEVNGRVVCIAVQHTSWAFYQQ